MNPPRDGDLPHLQAAIRQTGARVTPARVHTLRLLQGARGPLTHREIEDGLTHTGLPGMDRVTLYRVLDWLCEVGLAQKAADRQGVFRFSATQPDVRHAAHMHVRCTGCGRVFCLDSPPPSPPALPKGFRLEGMAVDLHGLCARCTRGRE